MNQQAWTSDTWHYYVKKKIRLQSEWRNARREMEDARRRMIGLQIEMAELDEDFQEQKAQREAAR